MSKNSWFRIVNKGANARSTVYIYDDIGLWGVTAQEFISDLEKVKGDFDLRMATGGGSIFEGLAIHNAIRNHPGNVQVYLDGVVASMGTYVMLAGDTIEMAENGWIMVHNPQGVAVGESADMRKVADVMDGLRETLLDGYVNATGLERSELEEMLDGETWLNASDALEKGFVNSIGPANEMAASIKHRERYSKIPDAFNKSSTTGGTLPQGAKTETENKEKNMSELRDKLVALNVVKHTASDTDAEGQLESFVNKAKSDSQALSDANERIQNLENENAELKEAAVSAALKGFEAQVDAAIEAKKVSEKQKDCLIAAFKADAENAEALLNSFEAPKASTTGTAPLGGNVTTKNDIEGKGNALPEKNEDGSVNYTNIVKNRKAGISAA